MGYLKFLTCVSAAFMLAACAQTRTDVESKMGYVEKLNNQATIAGSHRIEIVRTVSWMSRSACSVLDFVTVVTAQDPTIHDVINIRADEGKTSSDDGEVMGYSCKYWGLAVRYVPMELPSVSAPVVQQPVAAPVYQVPEVSAPVEEPAPVVPAVSEPVPVVPEPVRPMPVEPVGESFVPSIETLN